MLATNTLAQAFMSNPASENIDPIRLCRDIKGGTWKGLSSSAKKTAAANLHVAQICEESEWTYKG